MKYTITLMAEHNFGEYGAICPSAIEAVEGETVEGMILRAMPGLTKAYGTASPLDHIILRVTRESAERLREQSRTDVPF